MIFGSAAAARACGNIALFIAGLLRKEKPAGPGGAFLFFEADGSIRIWGGSGEFVACDRDYAAALVKAARPRCRIVVSSGEMT